MACRASYKATELYELASKGQHIVSSLLIETLSMSKVWFITGSSRGLGRAFTEVALGAGHLVVATARKPEQLADLSKTYGDRVRTVRLDVTSPAEVERAVVAAKEAFGRIDVVVNNAGYGFVGAFEEMTSDEFKGQIDTNFWGVVHVTRAVLSVLREQGFGHIIQVTSVGGRLGVPGLSGYHAAKFAVEGLSEALAQEIKPIGLKLTIVEPGGFRTDWAGSSMAFAKPMRAYAPVMDAIRGYMGQHSGHHPGDPRKAGHVLLELVETEQPPLRLPLGKDAIMFLRNSCEANRDELGRWADISGSTDFDDVTASTEEHPVLQLLETFKA
jgi:NAD(P)-dependent dehydrogenase (short-subunit alcohol dehydrogenase family)